MFTTIGGGNLPTVEPIFHAHPALRAGKLVYSFIPKRFAKGANMRPINKSRVSSQMLNAFLHVVVTQIVPPRYCRLAVHFFHDLVGGAASLGLGGVFLD